MTKDLSVTKLNDDTLILDHHYSMDKMPSAAAALAGMPISPSNNTLNYLPTQASSQQVQLKSKLKQSPSRSTMAAPKKTSLGHKGREVPSSVDENNLYAKDLGTMGIPREVARLDQQSNFLYTSGNPLGPGDY